MSDSLKYEATHFYTPLEVYFSGRRYRRCLRAGLGQRFKPRLPELLVFCLERDDRVIQSTDLGAESRHLGSLEFGLLCAQLEVLYFQEFLLVLVSQSQDLCALRF